MKLNNKFKLSSKTQIPVWIIIIIALLCALSIRLLFLGGKSIWLDEAWGLSITKAGQNVLWSGSFEDHHPPLFHLIQDYWIRMGESEFMLRLLSVIFGTASILLIYRLGRDLAGKRAALSGVWLATFSPLLIWYSQEARSYSFLIFIGLATTIAVVNLFFKPNLGWFLFFTASMTAALYTHYAAFLLIPIHLILLSAFLATRKCRIHSLFLWLTGWIITIAAYWPWLKSPAARAFFHRLKIGAYPVQILAKKLKADPVQLMNIFAIAIPITVLIGLFLIYHFFRKHNDFWSQLPTRKWAHVFLMLGFLILLAASTIPRAYSVKKQLAILWPFVLLIFCWLWPWRRPYQKLLTVLLILSLLASIINVYFIPKDQWRETANFILKQKQVGDVVLLLPSYMTYPFDYYSQGRITRHGIHPSSDSSQLESLLDDYGRIWLISHLVDIADPEQKVKGWLDYHADRVEEKSFYRIQVSLYQR